VPSTQRSRWRALLSLLRPDAARWVALGVLLAVGSALGLAGPLVIREIIDRATDGATTGELTRLALAFLGIAVATQATAVVASWYATIAAWRTTNGLRITMAEHVLGLDHEFHRRHTPGELIQRVDGDVTSVSDFLGRVVPKAFGSATLVGGMIGVLAVLDWRLAVGMTVYVGAAVLVVVATRNRAIGEASDEMGSYARLYGGIEERLNAAEDLRSNGAASHAMWRFVDDSAYSMTSSVRRERAFLTMWWAVQGSVVTGSVLSLVTSALLVGRGVITLGTAFLLFQCVLLISRPLEEVVHELETVQKANGAMVRVIDLLSVRPTVLDEGTTSPPAGPLSVELRDVSFDYGDDEMVLDHVDLDIARRPFRRRRGPDRQRQDHVLAARAAPRRGHVGHRPPRRRPHRRHPDGRAPSPRRARSRRRSSCSVARCATTSRCSTRRRPTRRSSMHCTRSGLGHVVAGGIHRAARRRGCRVVGRRGPVARARPGLAASRPISWCSTRPPHASIHRPRPASMQPSPS
jgi:ABC-type bacteriocin/lantibiotic exporter with double-glycine peptidase domain